MFIDKNIRVSLQLQQYPALNSNDPIQYSSCLLLAMLLNTILQFFFSNKDGRWLIVWPIIRIKVTNTISNKSIFILVIIHSHLLWSAGETRCGFFCKVWFTNSIQSRPDYCGRNTIGHHCVAENNLSLQNAVTKCEFL